MEKKGSSSRPSSRGGGEAPASKVPLIVGVGVVALLAGGFWIRRSIESSDAPVVAVVPTRPPQFQLTPFAPRRQPEPRFDSGDDSFAVPRAEAPVARPKGPSGSHAAAPAAPPDGAVAPQAGAPSKPGAAPAKHRADAAPVDEAANADDAAQAPVVKAPANGGAALSVTFDGGSPTAGDGTEPIIAQGLQYDQAGAARFGPGAQLAYPDRGGIDPNQGTIAFWSRLENNPGSFGGRGLAQLRSQTWANRLEINMGSQYIGLVLTTSDGVEQTVSSTGVVWAQGVWHHIATTWGEAIMQLFIDGNLADQEPYIGTLLLPPDAPLYVGSQRTDPKVTPSPDYPVVSLRGWKVFQRILEPEEIAQVMTQTAPPAN